MLKRSLLISVIIPLLAISTFAQVAAPKRRSWLRRAFDPGKLADDLSGRFNQLKCALVLIEAGPRMGTGFYISADGDVATASHVLGDRRFSANATKGVNVNFAVANPVFITNSDGLRIPVPAAAVEFNPDAWIADVARIKTGRPTSCWLTQANDLLASPGEHLITMGFPGLSFENLTLYTGIMSARLKTNLPTIVLDTGQAVTPSNDFIRVQMPISTGLSGAPVIDDQNRALAIVTNAGGWTRDLDNLMLAFRAGAFNVPQPTPNPSLPPNTVSFALNPMGVTAELAGLFHDFASPGYGDAVPLRYLQKPQQQNQPSASHGR